jgi:leader peptidase (prepilin peptidase)/N-methyltransferase
MTVLDLLARSPGLVVGTCLVLGLLVGSFLNVVIYRLPVMLDREWRRQADELAGREPATEPAFNLVTPRSSCRSCKAQISAVHNVPVVSWVLLRGRCASCGVSIPARYPLVEALTGLLSAAVAWKFGFGVPLAGALVLTWFLVALAFIDLDHQLLPDVLTLPLLWGGLLLALVVQPAAGVATPVDLRSAVIGAIAGYLSLWSVYHLFRLLTGKEGMGYGDFKLLAALGAWMGWQMLLPVILMSAVVGAVVGVAVLSIQGKDKATPIPFGPFLAAAGWIVLLFGPEIVGTYLGMFAPGRP